MAQTPTSGFLHDRLRERKAQALASSENGSDTVEQDEDSMPEDQLSASRGGRSMHDSPAGPSAWRYDHCNGASGRKDGGATPTSSTSNMGLLAMQDHVKKLSNTNFDLKMNVHHKAKKIEELEAKLVELEQLKLHCADLIDINEDLEGKLATRTRELKERDDAVDQAVVMICDLEKQVQELEARQEYRRGPPVPGAFQSGTEQAASVERLATPPPVSERQAKRLSVSPDVSARLAGLALGPGQNEPIAPLPSFLRNNAPETSALRSTFMKGQEIVRPIPSYGTLLSMRSEPGDHDDPHEILKSPVFSEVSDSEVRSIYGREEIYTASQPTNGLIDYHPAVPSPYGPSLAQENPQLRVNRWVTDPAIPQPRKRANKMAGSDAGKFQSLGDVLQRPVAATNTDTQARAKTRATKDDGTPPMLNMTNFGQNVFPPTPDTMTTRPSNHSAASIVQERSQAEIGSFYATAPSTITPGVAHQKFNEAQSQPRRPSPASMLPMEIEDSYNMNPSPSRAGDKITPNNNIGGSSYRARDAQRSLFYNPRGSGANYPQSFAINTMVDGDSVRDYAHVRTSPSPPRFFNSRRKSMDSGSPTMTNRPARSFSRTKTEPGPAPGLHDSIQTTPIEAAFAHTSRSQQSSSSSLPHGSREYLPAATPLHSVAMADAGVQSESRSASRLLQRAASIRNKFRRRNSVSAATEASETATSRPSRSRSITDRFRFRRASSTHEDRPPTAGAPPTSATIASLFSNSSRGPAPNPSQKAVSPQQGRRVPVPLARNKTVGSTGSPTSRVPPTAPAASTSFSPGGRRNSAVPRSPTSPAIPPSSPTNMRPRGPASRNSYSSQGSMGKSSPTTHNSGIPIATTNVTPAGRGSAQAPGLIRAGMSASARGRLAHV